MNLLLGGLLIVAVLGGPFRWLMQAGALSRFTTGLRFGSGYHPAELGSPAWVGGCWWRSQRRWKSHATEPLMRLEMGPHGLRIGPSSRLLSSTLPTFTIPRDQVTSIQPRKSGALIETAEGSFFFTTAPHEELVGWWQTPESPEPRQQK